MRKTLTGKILKIVAEMLAAGTMAVSPSYGLRKLYRQHHQGELIRAIYDLKKHGFLEEVEIKGEKWLKITSKGRLKNIRKESIKKWDGLWRIIAFDIPETRKKTRDVFRLKLRQLNCQPVQKSVWLSPSDISVELENLLDILGLTDNVDYFISKALTNDEKYRKMFKIDKLLRGRADGVFLSDKFVS